MIIDWDDAYENRGHVAGSAEMIAAWYRKAEEFRAVMEAEGRTRLAIPYGNAPRQRLDLFLPRGKARGLAVYLHGGYWRALDRESSSHFAAGVVEQGWACAVPGYTLCPDIRISGITREIAAALQCAAGLVPGPIVLAGHSAGGQLALRMVCRDLPMDATLRARIAAVLSISGVHDLRPLLRTRMNEALRLDEAEAAAESPALKNPVEGLRVRAWCGGAERPEFIRQTALIANIWTGLGADCAVHVEPDRHHFDIVDALADPGSAMVADLLGGVSGQDLRPA